MGTLKTPHISTHYLHILIMSSHQRLLSSTSRRALSRYASTSYFSNSAAGSSHSFSSVGAAQHHLVFKNNNINNINNKKHVFSTTTGSHDDFAAKSHVDASNAHENRLGRCERNRGDLHERKSERPSVRFFKRRLSHFRPLRDPVRVENVLASDALRNGIKSFSNWPTIPQVFVGGEFLGGSDILMTMHQDGSLKKEFERVGLTVKTTEGSD